MTISTEFQTQGAIWWRKPCHITTDIVLSGDLHHREDRAITQLEEWKAEGVTHILDCREEWNEQELIAKHGDGIDYYWHGTHDAGGSQDARWYQEGWAYYSRIFDANPEAKVMVNCHMGINRAPSMVFFLMLMEGYEPKEALSLIRKNRPIAACYYAESAWATFADVQGLSLEDKTKGLNEINDYFVENKINLAEVIHEVRAVEHK
tara:strand:- start:1788 stop:2405 length:618 start_codon:yes stop_codon:yes gene_type:complete